ncbi:hypothetical protein PF004_g9529 [Phytophthora fragariae]|uniref:HAT C-terminal dimerisation domain-containing protein n=2 Tax=Phytophthora fragariae TaxID=53985 RepID=A0A6G0P3L1_9STRA|nr:hypothetical protein PF004_g9529 [Phytophthora fragariae]
MPVHEVEDRLARSISKLRPVIAKAVNKCMEGIAIEVGQKLGKEMGTLFALMFDGWSHAGIHYVALSAVNETDDKLRVPPLGLSPLEDDSQTADARIKLFGNILDVYHKTNDMVDNLMVELRHENNHAELKKHTELVPVKRNVTRWSSTFTMVQRYIRIRAEFEKKFESICKRLQRADTCMGEVRTMYDALIAEYPVMSEHLKSTAKIFNTPAIETGGVKVIMGSTLSSAEAAALKRFELPQPAGKKRKEREEDYATMLLQGKEKKRKQTPSIAIYMPLVKMVPPTSNTVERTFSQCKLVLTPQRRAMLPANIEQLAFLRVNRI